MSTDTEFWGIIQEIRNQEGYAPAEADGSLGVNPRLEIPPYLIGLNIGLRAADYLRSRTHWFQRHRDAGRGRKLDMRQRSGGRGWNYVFSSTVRPRLYRSDLSEASSDAFRVGVKVRVGVLLDRGADDLKLSVVYMILRPPGHRAFQPIRP